MVDNFIKENSGKISWAAEDILKRGQTWAKEYYEKVVTIINEII